MLFNGFNDVKCHHVVLTLTSSTSLLKLAIIIGSNKSARQLHQINVNHPRQEPKKGPNNGLNKKVGNSSN